MTCLTCFCWHAYHVIWGHGTFSAYFFCFQARLQQWNARDMFDMFSLTCLACDKGVWHFFQSIYFVFKLDLDMFDHVMLTCNADMTSTMGWWHVATCLTCFCWHAYHVTWGGALFSPTFFFEARLRPCNIDMSWHVSHVFMDMLIKVYADVTLFSVNFFLCSS